MATQKILRDHGVTDNQSGGVKERGDGAKVEQVGKKRNGFKMVASKISRSDDITPGGKVGTMALVVGVRGVGNFSCLQL